MRENRSGFLSLFSVILAIEILCSSDCFAIVYTGQSAPPGSALSLWFRTASARWLDALPVGNGRIGAMVYGTVDIDTLALNESTCWSGGPMTTNDNANGASILSNLQTALLPPVNMTRANSLFGSFCGNQSNYGTNRPFANLSITFTGVNANDTVGNYRRTLDISNAVCEVSYGYKGAQYLRETFASNPDQVIVMRFSCSQSGKISFTARINVVSINGGTGTMSASGNNTLLYNGQVFGGTVQTSARLLALNAGGTMTFDSARTPDMVNDNNSGIHYYGWAYYGNRGLGDYNDDGHFSSTVGDSCTCMFNGTGIDYLSERYSDMGNVDVYIDGIFRQNVNLYVTGARQVQQTVCSVTNLAKGNHTIKIVNRSTAYGCVDVFKVYGADSATVTDGLRVTNADAVVLLLALATDYDGNPAATKCQQQITAASAKSYGALASGHVADYQRLFNRVTLDLGAATLGALPTDQRIGQINGGARDPYFDMIFYQYSRYLMISGSRENSPLPLHLQGIWNDNLAANMPWTCDYHLDINTQQNQWLATTGNLPEANVPVISFLKNILVPKGRATASVNYGKAGWVAHFSTNAWGWSSVINAAVYGPFMCGGAWLASELWKQYEFFGDTALLRSTSYPILKEAAQFYLAEMVTYPGTNYLVNGPTCSAEHGQLCMMPTGDRTFIYDLFTQCIKSCNILQIDSAFKAQVIAAQNRLPPLKISQYGQLQEWYDDITNGDDGHRHTTHLVDVFPYDHITPEDSPSLCAAALLSLQRRLRNSGWENTEWSAANSICYYSRFKYGDSAYLQLNNLWRTLTDKNLFTMSPKGIAGAADNIFAIDGNMAAAAGMNEMLLQSHRDRIEFIPALPHAWPTGSAAGLAARGAFEVDLTWANSQFVTATVLSKTGSRCGLKGTGYYVYDQNNNAIACSTGTSRTSFATVAGMKYRITLTPLKTAAAAMSTLTPVLTKVFKITGEKFSIPVAGVNRPAFIFIYDLTGRLHYKATVKKHIINLRKDFGLSIGNYIVRCTAAP